MTKIIAQTSAKSVSPANEIKVEGNEKFKIKAQDFIISPLQSSADIHIISIYSGVEDDKVLDTINAGEYTQISGLVGGVTLYVDTDETFYVRF